MCEKSRLRGQSTRICMAFGKGCWTHGFDSTNSSKMGGKFIDTHKYRIDSAFHWKPNVTIRFSSITCLALRFRFTSTLNIDRCCFFFHSVLFYFFIVAFCLVMFKHFCEYSVWYFAYEITTINLTQNPRKEKSDWEWKFFLPHRLFTIGQSDAIKFAHNHRIYAVLCVAIAV